MRLRSIARDALFLPSFPWFFATWRCRPEEPAELRLLDRLEERLGAMERDVADMKADQANTIVIYKAQVHVLERALTQLLER